MTHRHALIPGTLEWWFQTDSCMDEDYTWFINLKTNLIFQILWPWMLSSIVLPLFTWLVFFCNIKEPKNSWIRPFYGPIRFYWAPHESEMSPQKKPALQCTCISFIKNLATDSKCVLYLRFWAGRFPTKNELRTINILYSVYCQTCNSAAYFHGIMKGSQQKMQFSK